MAPANYERLSVEDGDAEHPLTTGNGQLVTASESTTSYFDVSKSQTIPPHPPIYYDDGPFDAPSSDSEEETLLEKRQPTSPNSAENGLLNGDNGLMLGEKRVIPRIHLFHYSY